jgi:rubredoxin
MSKKRANEGEQDMTDELLVEEVEEVTGGNGADINNQYSCPNCKSTDFTRTYRRISSTKTIVVNKCNVCGTTWKNSIDNSGSNDDMQ